jgi:hypothetical protein
MKVYMEPVPGGHDLLEFVNYLASELEDLRGFELPTIALLLHLDRTPGRQLRCSRAELSRLSGTLESTAWRLAKILNTRNLIGIEDLGERHSVLSLTPYGRSLLFDLASAMNS